jgi:hypothetical protein
VAHSLILPQEAELHTLQDEHAALQSKASTTEAVASESAVSVESLEKELSSARTEVDSLRTTHAALVRENQVRVG